MISSEICLHSLSTRRPIYLRIGFSRAAVTERSECAGGAILHAWLSRVIHGTTTVAVWCVDVMFSTINLHAFATSVPEMMT